MERPSEFNAHLLAKAMQMLNALPPEEERIDHARVGKDYMSFLKTHCTPMIPTPTYGGGMLASWVAMNIIQDDDLPPDVCEFRNKDGKVLKRLKLEP